MERWMNGWIDGQTDGWMFGQTDGWMPELSMSKHSFSPYNLMKLEVVFSFPLLLSKLVIHKQ